MHRLIVVAVTTARRHVRPWSPHRVHSPGPGRPRGRCCARSPSAPTHTPQASTVASTSEQTSAARWSHRRAGRSPSSASSPAAASTVTIATDDGYAVTLLQLGATSVERGSTLTEGTEVGVVGESSDAATLQPHVHLGVRIAADPNGYVDPLGLLPARQPAPAPPPSLPEPPVAAPPPAVSAEIPAPQPAPAEPTASEPAEEAPPPNAVGTVRRVERLAPAAERDVEAETPVKATPPVGVRSHQRSAAAAAPTISSAAKVRIRAGDSKADAGAHARVSPLPRAAQSPVDAGRLHERAGHCARCGSALHGTRCVRLRAVSRPPCDGASAALWASSSCSRPSPSPVESRPG